MKKTGLMAMVIGSRPDRFRKVVLVAIKKRRSKKLSKGMGEMSNLTFHALTVHCFCIALNVAGVVNIAAQFGRGANLIYCVLGQLFFVVGR